MNRFGVVVIVCTCAFVANGFIFGSDPDDTGTIAEWKSKMTTFSRHSVYLKEHADIVGDGNQILMYSEDDKLEDVYLYKALSYHDYDTKPGILGIKYFPYGEKEAAACFIGETVKDFDQTVKDIKRRNGKVINTCHNGKHNKITKKITTSGSDHIDQFCKNLPMYQMVESNYQQGLFDEEISLIRPWRVGTRCIYGPIIYWFLEELDVTHEQFKFKWYL